jgi:hypothetical protein
MIDMAFSFCVCGSRECYSLAGFGAAPQFLPFLSPVSGQIHQGKSAAASLGDLGALPDD